MAGRTISAANESKLRAAMESIGAVLASLGGAGEGAAATEAAGESTDWGDDTVTEESAVVGDFVPLSEAAVRKDGTALIKVIAPGWGSSGYYSPEVLKRDGPQVFKTGLKGWWDHPTAAQEAERPEGSLANLASELIGDARWQDGPAGPGLYAEAKIFGPYREAVNELAPHVGVSIRASGRTRQGEAEGRKGPIIEQLVAARSVDWVTVAGAGGKIVQMFEAARPQPAPIAQQEEPSMDLQEQLAERDARILTLQQDTARLREANNALTAREMLRTQLAGAQLLEATRTRLLESLASNLTLNADGTLDGAALAAKITEAIAAEQAYLAEVAQAAGYGSGRITGMGGGKTETVAVDVNARMKEAFGLLGLSPAEAETAARGR